MADGSITIDTIIDDSGVKAGVNNIESGFDKLKSVITKTIAALGLGKLTKDFISTGIQYNAEIEKYQTALTTLTGSAEEANKIIKQIKEDAAKTPFDVAGLTQANQLLISTGLSAEDSRETILALGNAVSATGGGNDELSRMALNLQQVKNLGKASSIDIKQFAMAGIDIYGLLADYLGITKQEAADMEVTWDDLNGALIQASQEGGKYFGAMEKQSATLNGQWSTLKDNFKEFTGEAMQPLTNLLKDTVLPLINDVLTNIEKYQPILTILAGIIGTITALIIAFNIQQALANATTGIWAVLAGTASISTTALGAAFTFLTSPIGLTILAIGALITIVVLLVKNWDTVKEKTLEIWTKVKDGLGEIIDKIVKWFEELPYNIGLIIGNVIKFFKELPGNIWIWLVDTINKINNWITNMKSKVSQGIPQIINSIINFFKELPSNMLNIGKNIVEGLWNGIKNATSWIKNKIAEFANGILSGIKDALGIHSPSKVFRDEVGKYIALGVGEGFTDNIKDVYKDMKTAVDFQTQKLSANLSTTASMNRAITVNMNLQGDTYMDSSKVGRLVAPAVSKTLRTAGA